MNPNTLDHVAFWLADREPIAEVLTSRFGMHVIDQQENFTLVGADARRGKLTLFSAEGPREQGAFKHVALRVAQLPEGAETEADLGEGVLVVLVEAETDLDYDLDHVALYSADPQATARAYERFGFDPAPPSADGHPRVEVGAESMRGQRAPRASTVDADVAQACGVARPGRNVLCEARIACEAGFADQSHFTRAFKRHTGLTPGQFRRLRR